MTIEWDTKNINIQDMYKAFRRCIILNGDDGTHLSGYKAWKKFKAEWKVVVTSTDNTEKYRQFFNHLNVETSQGIAWGITGNKEMYLFVNDKI